MHRSAEAAAQKRRGRVIPFVFKASEINKDVSSLYLNCPSQMGGRAIPV